MIDPKKNFLLKRGELIGDVKLQSGTQSLYKLEDGRLIVHHQRKCPMRGDRLERIEPWLAEHRFQVKV